MNPFLVAEVNVRKDGQGQLNVNAAEEPVWADLVPAEEWHNEVSAFPRSGRTCPTGCSIGSRAHRGPR